MTNAKRFNSGKPAMSYVMEWYDSLQEVAKVAQFGEEKYNRGNYRLGLPITELLDCAGRHEGKFMSPFWDDKDDESKLVHLAHSVWNLLTAMEQLAHPEIYGHLDNRTKIEEFTADE